MKKVTLFLLVACLLALGGQSFAELCTIDNVPAATLLLPLIKSDIGDGDGDGRADCNVNENIDTFFMINNASAAPALAHVTLWTDWSFPTLDFDVFLTGYDVQSVSMCQVIGRGNLPITADAPADPNDTISPHNDPSHDGTFAGCGGVFPFPSPALSTALLDRVQNGHAGFPVASLGDDCVGEGLNGDGACVGGSCPPGTIARGYATIDSVDECSTLFPNEDPYFECGGTGIANNNNVLWGDWYLVDGANDFAEGNPLVHIEAHNALDAVSIPVLDPTFYPLGHWGLDPAQPAVALAPNPHGYTFYGRYATATDDNGCDNREPLGTMWAVKYFTENAIFDNTKLNVWRDSGFEQTNNNDGWGCGLCINSTSIGPPWCPLNENQVVCWDEEEDPVEVCFRRPGGVISPPDPGSNPPCFPLEANWVTVGVGELDPMFPSGWCFLNLNCSAAECPNSGTPDPDILQSYVTNSHSALGQFTVGYAANQLVDACQTNAAYNPGSTPIWGDIPTKP